MSASTNQGILWIAPIIEPGRSGVGDYTRRLAEVVAARGWRCRLAGLAGEGRCGDTGQGVGDGLVEVRSGTIDTLRERREFKRWIELDPPGWVSLQYVCYGYHSKGLPFALASRLRRLLPTARFHVMFHETWSGGASWRRRLIGELQRQIAKTLVRVLDAEVVHSHALPYIEALRGIGIPARELPLFSNIPVKKPWPRERFVEWLAARAGGSLRVDEIALALFGAIYPEWTPATLLDPLEEQLDRAGRCACLITLGHSGAHITGLREDIRRRNQARLRHLHLGPLDEEEISQVLHRSTFGVSATPPDLIQKSAAAAALFAHGLPVVASREPVFGEIMLNRVRKTVPLLIAGEDLRRILDYKKRHPDDGLLQQVAGRFLEDLSLGQG